MTIRIRRELRDDLERAAQAAGKSLNQEVQDRLKRFAPEQAFAHQSQTARAFGALAAELCSRSEGASPRPWTQSRYAQTVLRAALAAALDTLVPFPHDESDPEARAEAYEARLPAHLREHYESLGVQITPEAVEKIACQRGKTVAQDVLDLIEHTTALDSENLSTIGPFALLFPALARAIPNVEKLSDDAAEGMRLGERIAKEQLRTEEGE